MGSNGVTVTKLLLILELHPELSHFLSQVVMMVSVAEVTKVTQVLELKVSK